MAIEEQKKEEGKKPEAHVSKYKQRVVKQLIKFMNEYPIIGALNMENMPASSLGKMRRQLREDVAIIMAKRRIMKYAFDEIKDKKGLEKLIPHLKGMPALLFTKENPFKLFKTIKKNKSPAAAKAGQLAPKDLIAKAGPTPFVPGPVIGELGAIGIKTEVKEGKIHIKEDSVVVKEGEEINLAAAGLLQRLGIEPMEVGLDLVAVYEKGVIYDSKVLDIDEEAFLQSLSDAGRWAFNLAIEAGYYTSETVNVLVPKAFNEAKALALEAGIMADAVAEELIAKAENQAKALKAKVKDVPVEDAQKSEISGTTESGKKEEVKSEEKPVEEKPAEEPKAEPKVEEKSPEPVEEAKEEPKVEEKPVEEKKEPELPSTEKVITDAIKKNEEASKEKVEQEEKEVKQEIAEIKKEVDAEKSKMQENQRFSAHQKSKGFSSVSGITESDQEKKEPDIQDIEKIEKEVEKVEEKLEKVEEEKQKLPTTEKIIIPKEEPKERKIDEKKKAMIEQGEKLFEQLKKQGTLREEKKEEIQPIPEAKTPQEIIDEAHKKMAEKKENDVPSAHDLLKKKLEKEKQ